MKGVLDLDNDSLANIFSYLSSIDVLNVECVNKRFGIVAKIYWQQKVHFDWKYEVKSINDERKRAIATVTICSRIEHRLKSMIVSLLDIDWRGDEFVSIGDFCPNITSITFDKWQDYFIFSTIECPSNILFNSFQSLKELHFYQDNDGFFKTVLSSVQLDSVPKSIEILTGIKGNHESSFFKNSDDFCYFFINHPELIEIDATCLNSADYELVNIFPVIASCCPRLKKISLNLCPFRFDGIELLEGIKVINLQSSVAELQMSDVENGYEIPKISDDQIISICNRNPELEIIDIFYEHLSHLTIRSIESIVGLKKLRELNANHWNCHGMSFDDQQRIIQMMFTNSGASLKSIAFNQNWFLTQRVIEIMADLCPLLRAISFCIRSENVSPELMRYLIDRIVERPEWKKDKDELMLFVYVKCVDGDEGDSAFASFEALNNSPLPERVKLEIYRRL